MEVQPVTGAGPMVDDFLGHLPVDAIELLLLCLEQKSEPGSAEHRPCNSCDAMRVLGFWFRQKRKEHTISRRGRRDQIVEKLAVRAGLCARRTVLGETQSSDASSRGDPEQAFALSLLGATADVLPLVGQRQALDACIKCLSAGVDMLATQIDATEAVEELFSGFGDLLELESACADDFVAVVTNLFRMWESDAARNLSHAVMAGFVPLSHALALAEMCQRGYFSISAKSPRDSTDISPGIVMAKLADLVTKNAPRVLCAEATMVFVVAGVLSAVLRRYDGFEANELAPLQNAIEHALELCEAPLSKAYGRTKSERKQLATVARGLVAAALATIVPELIGYQLEDAGLPVSRGVPDLPLPQLPRRAVALILHVLIRDVLRLAWSFEAMANAGIGDIDAREDLNRHVNSELFAQREHLAAALGAGFCALSLSDDNMDGGASFGNGTGWKSRGVQQSLRATIIAELCSVAQKVYDFTLDSGMVALMQRVPAAQAILKAAYESFASFAAVALEIPPPNEKDLAATNRGGWIFPITQLQPPSLVSRLTGDECAAVIMAATQLEVVSTAGEREDGFELYYQGLSDALAAALNESVATTAADADIARLDIPPPTMAALLPWQLELLNCIPEYQELFVLSRASADRTPSELKSSPRQVIASSASPNAQWRPDPAVLTRCYLSLLLVGAPDVILHYPWEAIEARVVPTIFLLLQHQRPPLNERAHGVFSVLFENYAQQAMTLFPQYIRLAVNGYPALTQPKGFATALGILVRTLSSNAVTATASFARAGVDKEGKDSNNGLGVDLAPVEWIATQLRRRCDELIPVAMAANGETSTIQMVTSFFGVYATLLLNVELLALPLVRAGIEDWLKSTARSGLANQMLFNVSP
eukprot:COSAG05_NODE_1024_length_6123_cov_7.197709_3_plen_879_part_00